MKILVINGSPKKKSDTMQITNAFLDGMMMASKHEVRIINSYDSKVEYCRGCGFPNSAHNFEPAVKQFKFMFPENQTVITVPESPMFNAPAAAIVTKPRLELIRKAGKQFAEQGFVDEKLLAEISSPMIPEEEYARIVNEGV